MSAGDFMRRAVGNVSNTIAQASSTVTSVAQGRKRYDISEDAVEKCTLTVKVGSFEWWFLSRDTEVQRPP